MKAYQLLYTGCGKDKSGAFSVWSQSREITRAEASEISRLCSYAKSKDVPYDLTPADIEKYCPKKYAYFTLSSGRKCLVKTTYVDQIYSDQDHRVGNFVIHAFVLDELGSEVEPFAVATLDAFKSELTYAEWHDSPAPDFLPPVDLALKSSVSERDLTAFVSAVGSPVAASLLQAAIESANGEKKLTINGSEAEFKAALSLVFALLPRTVTDKLTFINQCLAQIDYTASSLNVEPMKIRRIIDYDFSSSYGFEELVENGDYAFNIPTAKCSALTAGRYAASVLETLEKSGLFVALSLREKTEKAAAKLGCDLDAAIRVVQLNDGNLAWFTGASELASAVKAAGAPSDERAFAGKLYSAVIKPKRWGFGSDLNDVISLVLAHESDAVRDELAAEILSNLSAFGTGGGSNALLGALKGGSLALGYDDAVKLSALGGKTLSAVVALGKECDYAKFDLLCAALKLNPSPQAGAKIQDEIIKIFRRAVAAEDLTAIGALLTRAASVERGADERLFVAAAPELVGSRIQSEEGVKFALAAVSTASGETKPRLLEKVVKANLSSRGFTEAYVAAANADKRTFDELERALGRDEEFKNFLIKKEAAAFKNLRPITAQAISRYLNDYYANGYDDGALLIKLGEYVDGIREPQKKVDELIAFYGKIAQFPDDYLDVMRVITYIERTIFKTDVAVLERFDSVRLNRLVEINARLVGAKIAPSAGYSVLFTTLTLRGKRGGDEAIVAEARAREVYRRLDRNGLGEFAKTSLSVALECTVRLRKSGKLDAATAIEAFLSPIVFGTNDFAVNLTAAMNGLGERDYYAFAADLFAYAFTVKNELAERLEGFARGYAAGLKRGDYKKLFKKLEESLKGEELVAVKKFTDKFAADNAFSFFGLFGRKK